MKKGIHYTVYIPVSINLEIYTQEIYHRIQFKCFYETKTYFALLNTEEEGGLVPESLLPRKVDTIQITVHRKSSTQGMNTTHHTGERI